MEGVLLIDKPIGPSSFQVVRKVRAISGIKRVGHAGTLDPLASGLLVVCLGRYTKLASLLTDGDKVYQAVFRLGETTASDDGESEVIKRCPTDHLTFDDVRRALEKFIGKIEQVPPKFSAIKVMGRRAYDMARADQDVELSARSVEIFAITVENWTMPEIAVRIHCSKGTYIRSLARDLGQALGVGAYAKSIRRIRSGGFDVDGALVLENLSKNSLLERVRQGQQSVLGVSTIDIDETDHAHLTHGRKMQAKPDWAGDFVLAMFDDRPVAILKKGAQGSDISRVI